MSITEKIYEMANPMAQELGLALVDVEWVKEGGRQYLRAYIDKPGGVSHADCKAFSHVLGEALDTEDVVPSAYVLEVSSPGLERILKTERDFAYFKGSRVEVRTRPPYQGQREWTGNLLGVDDREVSLETEGSVHHIPRDQVSRIRLTLD